MANVAALPAAVAAAANRDPAVDRSLRSVFGECFSLSCPVAAVYLHKHGFYRSWGRGELKLANVASLLLFC